MTATAGPADAPPATRELRTDAPRTTGMREVELSIEGMTCAACAVRIEKKLNKLDDVRATVNYATATARVTAPAVLPVQELIAAVEPAGYTATARDELAGDAGQDGQQEADRHSAYLRAG